MRGRPRSRRSPSRKRSGKETPFLCHFYTKNASFYQDRLGTNIGKALKKRVAFPYRWPGDWLPLGEILTAAGAKLEQQHDATAAGGGSSGGSGSCSVDYSAALRWYMALPPLASQSQVPRGSLAKRLTVIAAGVVAFVCVVLLMLPALGLLNWSLQEAQEAQEAELRR